jgi:ABC-type sulfate transport system permease component
MKNLNTPLAIVIASIILSIAFLIVSLNDPLAKYMDKVIKNSYGTMTSKV